MTSPIRHLMAKIGRERGRSLRLAPLASRALLGYPWPGNVRELENALEYATTVCEGQTIHVADLPREVGIGLNADAAPPYEAAEPGGSWDEAPASHRMDEAPTPAAPPSPGPGKDPAETHEVRRIRAALEQAHYRKGVAAQLLGISRTTLWRKMRELGL